MTSPVTAATGAGDRVLLPGAPRAEVVGWSLTMAGLCIFSATIVTSRLPLGEVGIALALLGLLIERPRIDLPRPAVIYFVFLLWALVGSFAAFQPDIARAMLFERLKFAIIFVIAVNALRTPAQVRLYLLILIVCFIAYPVRGALQNYLIYHYTYHGRAIWNAGYSNPNDLGAMCVLAMGISLAVGFGRGHRLAIRVLTFFGLAALLWVIFLTQSRGAFIGLVVGFGTAFTVAAIRRPANLVFAVLALLVVSVAVPTKVWDRLSGISKLTSTTTLQQADPEGSAAERWEIQKTAVRIAVDHPLLGVGLGNYPIANVLYSPKLGSRDTHNTYLNLWAETGIPGLILWIWFVVTTLRGFRSRSLPLEPAPPKAGGAADPKRQNLTTVARGRAVAKRGAARLAPEGLKTVWIWRAVIGVLVSGIFGTYSNLTLLYLLLGVLACPGVVGQPESAAARLGSPSR